MQQIKTIEVVRLHTGNLKLTDEQVGPRKHLLEPVEGKCGVYTINGAVTFKAGEVFGYDGELKPISNKALDAESGDLLADVLLERKVQARLAEAKGKKAPGKKSGKTVDPQNVADILGILGELDPAKDFTSNGEPEVKAIEALLDRDITAAERDAAWTEYSRPQAKEQAGNAGTEGNGA